MAVVHKPTMNGDITEGPTISPNDDAFEAANLRDQVNTRMNPLGLNLWTELPTFSIVHRSILIKTWMKLTVSKTTVIENDS